MSKESINLNPAPKQKKVWLKPEVYVLGTDNVNGGTHPGVHEKSITNSIITGGGSYLFLLSSGGNTLLPHNKHWYNS
jgi:hypothetical protein